MSKARRPSTLRLRWRTWRARFSIPSLLASHDEHGVVSIVVAVNAGLAILVIGLVAWFTDLPLIFPALGPTAFILFSKPFSPDATPRSVVVGHFTGMISGLVARYVVASVCDDPISLGSTGWPSLCSASLALALTGLLLVRLSCPHAPACASALIIALGAVADWRGLLAMAIGVVMLTLQAICVNRLACLNISVWSAGSENIDQRGSDWTFTGRWPTHPSATLDSLPRRMRQRRKVEWEHAHGLEPTCANPDRRLASSTSPP
ncbi:MAG: HPP family protein [Phycisphaerae bacterium]